MPNTSPYERRRSPGVRQVLRGVSGEGGGRKPCATLRRVSEDPASPAAPLDDRLRIVYELACERDEDAFARAREIAFEQTVELPEACVPAALQRAVVARLEGMERLDKRSWRATLSYAAEIVGGEV